MISKAVEAALQEVRRQGADDKAGPIVDSDDPARVFIEGNVDLTLIVRAAIDALGEVLEYYREGFKAHEEGEPVDDNPYLRGCVEYDHWWLGWKAAEAAGEAGL